MHVDDTNDAFVSQMAAYNDQNFTDSLSRSDGSLGYSNKGWQGLCVD